MFPLVDLLFGFFVGVVFASFFESYFHDNIQHGSKKSYLHKWSKLDEARMSHETVHHFKTYKKHTKQFEDSESQAKLDLFLDSKYPHLAVAMKEEKYGVSLAYWSMFQFCAAFIPPFALMMMFILSLTQYMSIIFMIAAFAPVFFVCFLSACVHQVSEIIPSLRLFLSFVCSDRYPDLMVWPCFDVFFS